MKTVARAICCLLALFLFFHAVCLAAIADSTGVLLTSGESARL